MNSVTYRLMRVGKSLVPVKEEPRRTVDYDLRSRQLGSNPKLGNKYYD